MNVGDMLTWMNDNGAAVSALATVATALVAIFALSHTARDSRERTRAVVIAEFRKAKNSTSTIDLVVRNAGQSVARDVVVKFDPEPVLPDDGRVYATKWLLQRYRQTIPTLAPGQELANIWHSADSAGMNDEPTADQVRVTISYRRSRLRRYSEVFPLDVDLIRMMTFAEDSTSMPGRVTSIAKSLEALSKASGPIVKAANYLRREQIEQENASARAKIQQIREQEAERQRQLKRDVADDDTTN